MGGRLLLLAALGVAVATSCSESQSVIDGCDAMLVNQTDASDADAPSSCGTRVTNSWTSGLGAAGRAACQEWANSRRPTSMPCAQAHGVVDDRGICYAADHCIDRFEYDECYCGDGGRLCEAEEACVSPVPGAPPRCVPACTP